MQSLRKMTVLIMAVSLLIGWGFAGQSGAWWNIPRDPQIKNIILFVGDGMHREHEIAASRYLYGSDRRMSFQTFPYKGAVATWDVSTYNRYALAMTKPNYDPAKIEPWVGYDPSEGGVVPYPNQIGWFSNTYFLNKLPASLSCTPSSGSSSCTIATKIPATDSASAATAWATGYKTDDGNLAWLPGDPNTGGNRNNDGSLKTIAEILREEKGMSIGVVSTVPFTHATPAAHVSHNKSRNNYAAIGDEIIRTLKPDVVIGGGHYIWSTAPYMSQALYTDSKAGVFTDYIFVEREAGKDGGQAILSGANKAVQERKKLFGLFGGAGGNFEPPVPTNDGSGVVNRGSIENPLLKDATIAALKVLSQNQNGFFAMIEQGDVDWANHANDYQWMIGTMWDLDEAVKAAIEFVHQPGDDIHWGNTLIIVTSDHSNSYMRLSKEKRLGEGELPQQVGGSPCTYNPGANTCFSYPGEEVAYYTGDHTNELVSLYAFGGWSFMNHFKKFEGAWYPCTRIIDNTQLFHIMTEAVGVNKESPLNVIVEEPDFCAPAWGMKY